MDDWICLPVLVSSSLSMQSKMCQCIAIDKSVMSAPLEKLGQGSAQECQSELRQWQNES